MSFVAGTRLCIARAQVKSYGPPIQYQLAIIASPGQLERARPRSLEASSLHRRGPSPTPLSGPSICMTSRTRSINLPFQPVITSPRSNPARLAGPSGSTSTTNTPRPLLGAGELSCRRSPLTERRPLGGSSAYVRLPAANGTWILLGRRNRCLALPSSEVSQYFRAVRSVNSGTTRQYIGSGPAHRLRCEFAHFPA